MEYKVTVVERGGGAPHEETIDLNKPWSGFVLVSSVIFNPYQPRKFFDQEALARLGASLRTGQEQSISAIPHQDPKHQLVRWMLVDGERRWRAIQMEGLSVVWISYQPGVTKDNIHTSSFKANWCKEGHTHGDTARAIDRELRSGKSYHEIGEMVGMSKAWATNAHALLKLDPELLKLMDPPTPREKRLPTNIALLMVNRPHEEQRGLWEENKTLPKKQVYDRVRLGRSATITSTGRKRKPSDEKRLVSTRISAVTTSLRGLNALPDKMFEVYAGRDINELLTYLRIAGEQLEMLKERLTIAASGSSATAEESASQPKT